MPKGPVTAFTMAEAKWPGYRIHDGRGYYDDYCEDKEGCEGLEPSVADELTALAHAVEDSSVLD